jgi:multidrug efflux pump subunit AcrA (membrane-fusion protein)
MRIITPILIAACVLVTSGCSKKEEESETKSVAPVQVAPVTREAIRRIVTADGVLYPADQAAVTPKISAPVEKFLVNRGDHVTQGQLLAVLESRDLAGAAAEGKSQVDQAEASYRVTTGASLPEEIIKSQGEVQATRQAVDATQKLVESRQKLLTEGAIARRLVDEAQVAYAQARVQMQTAQEHLRTLEGVAKEGQTKGAAAQVDAAKGHYQAVEAQLGYSQIRSPINGVVADRPLYAGEMASAGTPLITVVDISRVVARANVPLDQAGYVKVGDPATVALSDGSPPVPGKVTVVSPATDPGSTTVQVWVLADNPGDRLRPGTAVRVVVVTATLRDAVVVPVTALLPSSEGGAAVMSVGSDMVAHQKAVKTGVREGGKVQVLEGVSVGEQVVITGGVGLEDGAKVRIEKPAEKSEEK